MITIDIKTITDTVFDVIQRKSNDLCPVFAAEVAEDVEKELMRIEEMAKGERFKVQMVLSERETKFIKEFAEKRGITKTMAVRTIIDMKMRQEELVKDD